MSLTETELPRVYEVESYGEISKKFHLQIFLDAGRELTREDKMAIQDCVTKLQETITAQTYKLNPKLKEQAEQEQKDLIACFEGHDIFVEEIPNGYDPRSSYFQLFPWLIVTTKAGRIKIGWRKRVINIDWEDSTIKKTGDDLFAGEKESTTVGDKNIHAWSYEKAKEYIQVLLNSK